MYLYEWNGSNSTHTSVWPYLQGQRHLASSSGIGSPIKKHAFFSFLRFFVGGDFTPKVSNTAESTSVCILSPPRFPTNLGDRRRRRFPELLRSWILEAHDLVAEKPLGMGPPVSLLLFRFGCNVVGVGGNDGFSELMWAMAETRRKCCDSWELGKKRGSQCRRKNGGRDLLDLRPHHNLRWKLVYYVRHEDVVY